MLHSVQDKRALAQIVAEEISKLIEDKLLEVGGRLPSESQLMSDLNVGRGTIREAIKILVSKNIVEIKRGVGTFVSENTGVANDPMGFAFMEDKHKLLEDTMELRAYIEPSIAAKAANNVTEEELEYIENLCDEVEALIRKGKDYTAKDIELHTKIAEASKNLVVSNLIPIINMNIEVLIDVTKGVLKEETIRTHRDLVNALKQHKAQAAYDAMKEHISINQERIAQINIDK